MRLRNVKYAKELLESYPEIVIQNPEEVIGYWKEVFNNSNPIDVEIGCGKGKFIYEMAKKYPQRNFIGIEKFDSVVVRALEKAIINPLNNLRLIRYDAHTLDKVFSKSEIKNIYLNFSDPWPKKRQAKRRLTSPLFLKHYIQIMNPNGFLFFKTDNYLLFEYSMMTLNDNCKFKIHRISLDLYSDEIHDNIQTEFEVKFISENKPIYYIASSLEEEKK
jgi:tRNA (guanine-N7-)-methyltransferase